MNGFIENRTFSELNIGESASIEHTLTQKDIQLFAVMSGDVNPAHLDPEYAKSDLFHEIVAHGMWGGSLISTVLGTQLPGPGTIYLSQTFRFLKPVTLGDTITAKVTVKEKNENKHSVILQCSCVNQLGAEVISGEAEVLAPTEKVRREIVQLPQIEFKCPTNCPNHQRIIKQSKRHEPLKTIVVHPVDELSLRSAILAAEEHLIDPILVGPEEKIRTIAHEFELDISAYPLISCAHSHEAAELSVKMINEGQAEAIMKGHLHTNELMQQVIDKQTGLRTGRRMSHIVVADLPNYPRPLFVTDAAINIKPNLTQKKDIVQNAVDLFLKIMKRVPRVAIISAIETVNETIPSTLDATALCKMAERGQIQNALIDGPLAFDNAISEKAAAVKNLQSQVAGRADILVVPDIESGNILLKQLALFSNASTAGIVMGAKVPIILMSRSSSVQSRVTSCALAQLVIRE